MILTKLTALCRRRLNMAISVFLLRLLNVVITASGTWTYPRRRRHLSTYCLNHIVWKALYLWRYVRHIELPVHLSVNANGPFYAKCSVSFKCFSSLFWAKPANRRCDWGSVNVSDESLFHFMVVIWWWSMLSAGNLWSYLKEIKQWSFHSKPCLAEFQCAKKMSLIF